MMAVDQDYDLIITNGICVTASDVAAYDVGIRDEKVVILAPSGSLAQAGTQRLIDAQGGYVTVGNTTPAEVDHRKLTTSQARGH